MLKLLTLEEKIINNIISNSFDWLLKNTDWFSGAGVVIITSILGGVVVFFKNKKPSTISTQYNKCKINNYNNCNINYDKTETEVDIMMSQISKLSAEKIEIEMKNKKTKDQLHKELQQQRSMLDYSRKALSNLMNLQYREDLDEVFNEKIKIAVEFSKKGDFNKAIDLFKDIVKNESRISNESRLRAAEAAMHQGSLAYYVNPEEAINAYIESIKLDPENQEAWGQLAKLHNTVGNLEQTLIDFEKSIRISAAKADHKNEILSYYGLAFYYYDIRKLEESKNLTEKGLQQSILYKFKKEEAIGLGRLGLIHTATKDLAKAEVCFKKSIKILNRQGSEELLAEIYGNFALLYITTDRIAKAASFILKAIKLFIKAGDLQSYATQLCNLGEIQQSIAEFEKAEANLVKSLSINKSIKSITGTIISASVLMNLYVTTKRFDKGLKLSKDIMPYLDKPLLKGEDLFFKIELAELFLTNSDIEKGEQYSKEAENRAMELGEIFVSNHILYRKAMSYLMILDEANATKVFNEAIKKSKATNDEFTQALCIQELAFLSLMNNNEKQAINQFLTSNRIFKSIHKKEDLARGYFGLFLAHEAAGNYQFAKKLKTNSKKIFKSIDKLDCFEQLESSLSYSSKTHGIKQYNHDEVDELLDQFVSTGKVGNGQMLIIKGDHIERLKKKMEDKRS